MLAERALFTPGRVVCVAADVGGYRLDRGFDPDWDNAVVPVLETPLPPDTEAQLQADESQDGEDLSAADWKTIACHVGEVAEIADAIATVMRLPMDLRRVLVLAARWHDLGKAHPAFQGGIRLAGRPDRQDLAKAPDEAWPRGKWLQTEWPGRPRTYSTVDNKDLRPGFRHELASALALFSVLRRYQPRHPALLGPWIEALGLLGCAVPEDSSDSTATPCEAAVLACSADGADLLAYLVASHHGKVRVALHAAPRTRSTETTGMAADCPFGACVKAVELPARPACMLGTAVAAAEALP